MKKTLLLVITFCSVFTLQAQETIFGRNSLGLTGLWGGFSYNFSYFDADEDISYLRGGYGGLEFGNTVFVGYAGYRLKDEVQLENLNQTFGLRYGGLMLDFHPGSHKVVHPRFGVILGGGRLSISDGNTDRVFVAQPSVGLEINIFRWFRLGVQGGYRFVGSENIAGATSTDFSSPYGQIDLRFGISWGNKNRRKRDRDRDRRDRSWD
jgi:hypothetical protein